MKNTNIHLRLIERHVPTYTLRCSYKSGSNFRHEKHYAEYSGNNLQHKLTFFKAKLSGGIYVYDGDQVEISSGH